MLAPVLSSSLCRLRMQDVPRLHLAARQCLQWEASQTWLTRSLAGSDCSDDRPVSLCPRIWFVVWCRFVTGPAQPAARALMHRLLSASVQPSASQNQDSRTTAANRSHCCTACSSQASAEQRAKAAGQAFVHCTCSASSLYRQSAGYREWPAGSHRGLFFSTAKRSGPHTGTPCRECAVHSLLCRAQGSLAERHPLVTAAQCVQAISAVRYNVNVQQAGMTLMLLFKAKVLLVRLVPA